jgi:hypothetical protein
VQQNIMRFRRRLRGKKRAFAHVLAAYTILRRLGLRSDLATLLLFLDPVASAPLRAPTDLCYTLPRSSVLWLLALADRAWTLCHAFVSTLSFLGRLDGVSVFS